MQSGARVLGALGLWTPAAEEPGICGANSHDSDEGGRRVLPTLGDVRCLAIPIAPMPEPTNEKVTMEDRRKFQDQEEQNVKAAQRVLCSNSQRPLL